MYNTFEDLKKSKIVYSMDDNLLENCASLIRKLNIHKFHGNRDLSKFWNYYFKKRNIITRD